MGSSHEVVRNEDGTYSEVSGSEHHVVEADENAEAAERSEAEKQDLVIPAPVKAAVTRIVTSAVERATSVLAAVKRAKENNERSGAPLPPKLGKEIQAISELLASVGEKYPSPKAGRSVSKVAEAGTLEEPDLDESAVEKAGARMSRSRFERFKQGMDLLMSVFGELSPTEVKAKQTDEEEKPPPQGKAAKAEQTDARVEKAVSELAGAVASLVENAKATNEKIEQLASARGESRMLKSERRQERQSGGVSWPLDMTRPVNRSTVEKELGFWDD